MSGPEVRKSAALKALRRVSGGWLCLNVALGCHAARPGSLAPMAPDEQDGSRGSSNQVESSQRPSVTPQPGTESGAQDYNAEPNGISDETEEPEESDSSLEPEPRARAPHPLDGLTEAELSRRLREDPRMLGAATLGRPNAGALFNASQMPENPAWKRVDPSHAWATPETIEYLTKALLAVSERYPDTAPVSIGHLSAQRGGPLRPHVSHQSGRDVDVGFYYSGDTNRWYRRATADNLDLPRTWWLIRNLVLGTNIEMILLDQSLIAPLERYALDSGEDREWVEGVFHRRNGRANVVRHAPGHATHLHLRFFNPIAQESGRRLMPLLVARGVVSTPPNIITHVARAGDTLAKLAARYSTTMPAIRQANGMKTYQLVAGTKYRIPVQKAASGAPSAPPPASRQRPATEGAGR